MKDLLAKVTDTELLWVVAFAGVCTLVGLGKLKPETVEYMLFAVVGRVGSKTYMKAKGPTDPPSEKDK
jgi:hypothetical protein